MEKLAWSLSTKKPRYVCVLDPGKENWAILFSSNNIDR
jgi:hypothetical protein